MRFRLYNLRQSTVYSAVFFNHLCFALVVLFFSSGLQVIQPSVAQGKERAANWSDDSHSKQSDPNYSTVFPSNQVSNLTITISADNWQAMQDNMVQLYGEVKNIVQDLDQNIGQDIAPKFTDLTDTTTSVTTLATVSTSATPSTTSGVNISGQSFALDEIPASVGGISAKPIWVQADISFNGRVWKNVGVRYKGNSSLSRSWFAGTKKMPFKLDFDQFEDDFPEIKNQRFYGFKQLSLNNNTGDASFLRDAASYKIMDDMGLVAPKTAWYDVYLDYGQGPERLGIYTMIEVIDDTVIKSYYGSDKGNIYEADGIGASLSRDTIAELMESFDKENNKASDYSDLAKLFQVVHSNYRESEAERWRSELEQVFDVETFLKWLATNTVMQNWDTYGAMAHNFYLYNVPETGQLVWIGWDYNESMGARAYGSTSTNPLISTATNTTIQTLQTTQTRQTMQTKGLAATATSLNHTEITDDWPLIRFLMDDPVYFEGYRAYVDEAISTAFNPESMLQTYSFWSAMLRPYAVDVVGFESEVARLKEHGEARAEVVYGFLGLEVIAKVVGSE